MNARHQANPVSIRRRTAPSAPGFHAREGSAVLIVLAVLALVVLFTVANVQVVYQLRNELRLMEHRQLNRWNPADTNAPPAGVLTNAARPDA